MEGDTLNTNVSSLSKVQAGEWITNFSKLAEETFQEADHRTRTLANLLVLERFINTLRQGLAVDGTKISTGLEYARRLLWNYLNGRTEPTAFQDFANDYYACLYAINVGDIDTDVPKEFYIKYFSDFDLESYELIAIECSSTLLMELVSIAGGRMDFDDFKGYTQIDFYIIDEIINLLEDACIELTHTPRPSLRASDFLKAKQMVWKTPLFLEIINHIQKDLTTALNACPAEYPSLQKEYEQYTILPQEYAKKLLEY